VNSAATGAKARVHSLSHAITVLGRNQLRRWLQLLLFTLSSAPAAEFPSPLLVLAATRGKLMELVATALKPGDRDFQDRAFMTGILSLVNALLGMPMQEIIGGVPLDQDAKQALLERTGLLGKMLALVEALEESGLLGIEKALEEVPGLAHSQVIGMQVEAMRWANSIGEAG
jgi:EAL and modified HD-GYP domain-containing signal transduction protein